MGTATARRWTSSAPRSPNAPVLVFIHGGYWRALTSRDHSFVAPAFNADGRAGGGAQLRAGPAVTIEHITLQMVKALEWVWRHAAEWRRPVAHRRGRPFGRRAPGGHAAVVPLEAGGRRPAGAAGAGRAVGLGPVRPGALRLTPSCSRPAAHARVGAAPEPGLLPAAQGQAVRGGGGDRERRVHPAEPADPRRVGPHGGAGVRDAARVPTTSRCSSTWPTPTRACMQLGRQLLGLDLLSLYRAIECAGRLHSSMGCIRSFVLALSPAWA
jgi:hypothetical protein